MSISKNFGAIWNAAMLMSILLPLSGSGAVLIWNYKRGIRRTGGTYEKEARADTVRYIIMLVAIAGGIGTSCRLR